MVHLHRIGYAAKKRTIIKRMNASGVSRKHFLYIGENMNQLLEKFNDKSNKTVSAKFLISKIKREEILTESEIRF